MNTRNFESIGLSVEVKKFKINFQDGGCDSHLRFVSGMILAIFALQITLIIPINFSVNWPFGSGEIQNRFA